MGWYIAQVSGGKTEDQEAADIAESIRNNIAATGSSSKSYYIEYIGEQEVWFGPTLTYDHLYKVYR